MTHGEVGCFHRPCYLQPAYGHQLILLRLLTSRQTYPNPDMVSSSRYQLLTDFSPPSAFHSSSSKGEGTFGRPSCDLRALSSGDCSFMRSMDSLFLGLVDESLRKDTTLGCAAATGPPFEILTESDSRRVRIRGDVGVPGGVASAMVDMVMYPLRVKGCEEERGVQRWGQASLYNLRNMQTSTSQRSRERC